MENDRGKTRDVWLLWASSIRSDLGIYSVVFDLEDTGLTAFCRWRVSVFSIHQVLLTNFPMGYTNFWQCCSPFFLFWSWWFPPNYFYSYLFHYLSPLHLIAICYVIIHSVCLTVLLVTTAPWTAAFLLSLCFITLSLIFLQLETYLNTFI